MKAECVVPSCSAREENSRSHLIAEGWRRLATSQDHGWPHFRWREVFGWCPDCAKHFGVREDEG